MGQRHWIRGLTRLFFLMALLAFVVPATACRGAGNGGLQPHRRRRQPAHRGGFDPRLRRDRAGAAGDARAAQPRGQEPLRHRPLRGRDGDARGRAAGHHGQGEPDDQPDRLRGERQPRRRRAGRGDPAPPAARLFGAGGGGGRAADHRGLPRRRALRRHGDPGHHPAVGEPGRPRLRDLRGAQDRGAADQLQRQPGLLGPPAAAGDRDQPDQLAELRLRRQHLRRRQARARQGAPAPVLPRARLHRRAGAVLDRRDGARAHRLLPLLHHLRGAAVQLRPGLGQLADPGPQRRGLPAAAGAGGEPGRLQRQAGRPGGPADELPGRAGGLRLRRDPAAGDEERRNRTVDINFEIVEGQRVFVERIDITGNTRTLDRVVRRQFHIVEGDAFNSREVQRRRGPHQRPRLLQDGHGQRAAGHHRGPGADRRGGRGAAHGQPDPRRRLLLERGPDRADRPDRAQLPRPRPDRLGDDLGEQPVRQRRVRLRRAGALRPRPARPGSTSTTATATSTSSRSRPRTSASSRASASR